MVPGGSHPARIVVLSDLHLAPSGPLASFTAGRELARFTAGLEPADCALVLAGDLFDLLAFPDRPDRLDLAGAPGLLSRFLTALAAEPWAQAFLYALGGFARGGGTIVVLPGNHDLELFHPAAAGLLRRAAGLEAEDQRLLVHTTAGPWVQALGGREVRVGHGHLADPWNRVDPRQIHAALANGRPSVPLPAGSQLVLGTINAFKRACDPHTGAPRFPFVDRLKPSAPWVPVLLLALDPALVLTHLPGAAPLAASALLRGVAARLSGGPTLGTTAPADGDGAPAPPDAAAALAAAITAGLDPAERAAPQVILRRLRNFLAGAPEPAPGTLAAAAGGAAFLLAAAARLWHEEHAFFDPARLGALDRRIAGEHLPPGCGRRAAVAGHTHAARLVHLDAERVYLNTGTWTDLVPFPASEVSPAALTGWLADLITGRTPAMRRLTYALLTEAGADLRSYPG